MANTAVIFGANNSGRILTPGGLLDYLGNPILPAQAGNAGKVLTTDGTTATWGSPVSASGSYATMIGVSGTNGQTYWDTTHKALWGWNTNRWDLVWVDPRYGSKIYEEFVGFNNNGQIGWTGSGASNLGNNQDRQGVWTISQSSASARSFINTYLAGVCFGTHDLFLEAYIYLPLLATVSQDFCFSFGFNDNTAFDANAACTDGAQIILNRAVNGANWITSTTQNGTNTSTNTSTAASAATWYRLGVEISATNSNVKFYVGTTTLATHTTNIPSGTSRETGITVKMDKTVGAVSSDAYIDYLQFIQFTNGTARVS